MDNIITVSNLSKSYGKKLVFDKISFSLPRNRIIGLFGDNGIGKTTILRLLADIIKPDSGEILISGQKVSRKTRDEVSFLLEPINFYSFMKVKDAVQYYRDFFKNFDYEKALRLCKIFEMDLSLPIAKLSQGNKERLCLLLNISRKVPLYLLDEPIGGFDPRFKRDLIKTILSNLDENVTMIISTHLLRDMESIFDEILILKKNEIVQATSDDIRSTGISIEEYYLEVVER